MRSFLCCSLSIVLCGHLFAGSDPADSLLKSVLLPLKQKFAPDRRTAVYDVWAEFREGKVVVKGDVDHPDAKEETVSSVAAAFSLPVVDSIRLLPEPALGSQTYGIVTLSVGNVRSRPGNQEELSTQVLMGMAVKILKRMRGYYFVQSPDHYLGWLDNDAVHVTDRAGVDAWSAVPKVIMTGYFGIVREQASDDAQPVCDVVAGGMLKVRATEGSWTGVELADGRSGFIESRLVEEYETWKERRRASGTSIEQTARMFVGVPYLWGGTSIKGMDCSGFTKTVFRLNNVELNRDANQQALQGTDIPLTDDLVQAQKGDLLFFGQKAQGDRPERISHVAIYLENKLFIHSSGRVRFGSFDPGSPYYDEYNLRRFVRARRVLPSETVPEVRR